MGSQLISSIAVVTAHRRREMTRGEEPRNLAELRRKDPEEYKRWMDQHTEMRDRDEPQAQGRWTALDRDEKLEVMREIKAAVLAGQGTAGFTDRTILTEALFFTAGTLDPFLDQRGVAKAVGTFIEYGAQAATPRGETLREVFEFTDNKQGLAAIESLGL